MSLPQSLISKHLLQGYLAKCINQECAVILLVLDILILLLYTYSASNDFETNKVILILISGYINDISDKMEHFSNDGWCGVSVAKCLCKIRPGSSRGDNFIAKIPKYTGTRL